MPANKTLEISEYGVVGLAQLYPGGCSVDEAADFFHVTPEKIKRWVRDGKRQGMGVRWQLALALMGRSDGWEERYHGEE